MQGEASEVRQYEVPLLFMLSSGADHKQARRNTIPKFASFRLKVDAPRDTPEEIGSRERRKKDQGVPSSNESTRRRHHSRHDIEADTGDLSDSSKFKERKSAKTGETYIVDKYGDPKILTYKTLDRYAIPKYSRFGAGRLIGLSEARKINRSVNGEEALVAFSDKHGQPKLRTNDTLRTVIQSEPCDSTIKPSVLRDAIFDLDADFVHLENTKSVRKRETDSDLDSDSLSAEDDSGRYRFLPRLAKGHDRLNDEDLQPWKEMSSSEDGPRQYELFHRPLIDRRRGLSQRIDADPKDLDAWLGLIACQDDILGHSVLTAAERYSNADIKMSMYRKALDHIQDWKARERLLLGLMQEASIIWDTGKLSTEWRSILRDNPSYLRLWTGYLDFKQTIFLGFGYEAVRRVYLECLEVLQHAGIQTTGGNGESSRVFSIQVHVLLRMTLFMREAGFAEHAVATWQAILEFQFFTPTCFHTKHPESGSFNQQEVMTAFEDFWESEVPRLGEEGAKGWAHFDTGKDEPPVPKIERVDQNESDSPFIAAWVSLERQHSLITRVPARTIDDVEENDPYRIILFSDVEPFLFNSQTSSSREIILDAFLVFCQLPPYRLGVAMEGSSLWWSNGFLRNQLLYDGLQRGDSPFDLLMWNFRLDQDTMFAQPHKWFVAFASSQSSRGGDIIKPVDPAWTLLSLKALAATNIANDEFILYSLAFELSVSPSTVRKTAKNILKQRSSSLTLYNAYALVEYRLGDTRRGENVIITALNMSKQLGQAAQDHSILLWRTMVWELLVRGNNAEAFQRLLSFTNGVLPAESQGSVVIESFDGSKALILRTEQALSATRDHLLSRNLHALAVTTAECLILLKYLCDPSTLMPASLTFKSNIDLLKIAASPDIPSLERLHQSFAHLIYHHATHTSVLKPASIHSFLSDSISAFPQNTMFLSLYAWNESRFRIDDRVRSIVRDVVLTAPTIPLTNSSGTKEDISSPAAAAAATTSEKSIIPHVSAIYTELTRSLTFGSNTNAIRAAFERSVDAQAAGAHCAGLWKLYFLFEHSRGDLHRAKRVFYRGIRACPWVKELYLLAFEYLSSSCRDDGEQVVAAAGGGGGGMSEAELRGLYDLLGEKELRVHVDMERMQHGA